MILAFDTSTDWLSIAIGRSDQIIAEIEERAPRAHLNRLLPGIDGLLKEAGGAPNDIEQIAVGVGPGSFTGVRIAISTAQGLAHAIGCPLIGISTLDTIAARLPESNATIYPILDAKRSEVYAAEYENFGHRVSDYQVLAPKKLAQKIRKSGKPVLITGDGLEKYKDIFQDELGDLATFSKPALWSPNASVLIKLAKEKIEKEPIESYFKVLPIYIRLSDAEESAKRGKL